MKSREYLQELFDRYVDNGVSAEEVEALLKGFNKENEPVLREKIHQQFQAEVNNGLINTPEEKDKLDAAFNAITEKINRPNGQTLAAVPLYKRRVFKLAIAASLILFIATTFFIRYVSTKGVEQKSALANKVDIAPGGSKAILTLGDGSRIILDSAVNGTLATQGQAKVIKLKGTVEYNGGAEVSTTLVYNTIATPVGGEYEVILADGTKVWLNTSSSLRFPTAFVGKERTVELTGEGYFEVAKNAKMPFNVLASGMNVKVLGTHFNIMAYSDENAIKTTLLEGSVKLIKGNTNRLLKPGQQGSLANTSSDFNIETVDVDKEVAWKDGYFRFDKDDLPTVMKQLVRWYNIEVQYEQQIPKKRFVGEIKRSSTLSQVLKILELSDLHFRLEGRKLIILK